MARLAALVVAFALVVGLLGRAVPADTGGAKARRFFTARQGVGLEVPPGWSLSLHTGYANVLCTLIHPGGSRISLAVDRTAAKDAASLAADSRPGLIAQGLVVDRTSRGPRDGTLVDARSTRRDQAIRQLYLVRPIEGTRAERQAIVLTLTTSLGDLPAASGPFDWVIGHLTLESPTRQVDQVDQVDRPEKPDAGR